MSRISLRPARFAGDGNDLEFLYHTYRDSRADEMAAIGDLWTHDEKEAFLRSQFDLQHRHYQSHYANASYEVICDGPESIGRYYVEHGEKEIRLMDIALLCKHRRLGIGGALIETLVREADSNGRLVSLHVEETNPAKRLYERLGFEDIEEVGPYWLMHRRPNALSVLGDAPTQLTTIS
jgi:ribosomal protein S18 acetylase RimI-like enzyme